MPLVTLTVQHHTPPATRRQLLDAVHAALVAVGVPAADRFQRVLVLPEGDFIFDAHYPHTPDAPDAPGAAAPRDGRFVIVEVLWSVGRSVKVKKQMLQHLRAGLADFGFDTNQLMLVFKETAWENWSFAGTTLLHA